MLLQVPPDYGIIKMIAIDPGSNTCGVAIYTLDTVNKTILSISAFTIDVDRLNDDSGLHLDYVTDRLIKLFKLTNCIERIIKEVDAKVIVSEAPFFNRFMPMAYGSLLEIVCSIQRAVYNCGNELLFDSYAPQKVKMVMGIAGKKGKDIVKEALSEKETLTSKIISDFDLLDEHSVDAIAVGQTFLELRSGKNVWK